MKKVRNSSLLPIMALISNLGDLSVGIGGSILIASFSRSVTVNSIFSSLESFGIIILTLFVGSTMDRISKKKALQITYPMLGLILLIPFFFNGVYFIYAYIVCDIIMTFIALFAQSAYNGATKRFIPDEQVDMVIGKNTTFGNIGLILSYLAIGCAYVLASELNDGSIIYKFLLLVGSIAYLLFAIPTSLLDENYDPNLVGHDLATNSTLAQIKKIYHLIKTNTGLRSSIILAIFISLLMGYFNSLMVYLWSSVDPQFANIAYLVVDYAIGTILGNLVLRTKLNFKKSMVLITLPALCLIVFAVSPSVYTLSICIIAVMLSCIPVSTWISRIRIRRTEVTIQSGQASFITFGSSILDVFFGTIVAGIFDLLKKPLLLPAFIAIITVIVFLILGKDMTAYEKTPVVKN
ncbi:hypothetical protein OZX69_00495 [Lactobacillus sp. ESL0731]|uniref:MFS transporter n=1 Tax=unclassified Lactobacillus TaxID=2620435 RepID=UPI0023F92D6E|nr:MULTISPECIES: MFS transporter [unclassified Lactobacillus]WEV51237.1 hypothetical protein OZX63_00495 [Lactobacillus sp. ESL0700]WEV62367.1 hypothetical protein OZX69_00495 [Lactobacillus sp. ESL0731]